MKKLIVAVVFALIAIITTSCCSKPVTEQEPVILPDDDNTGQDEQESVQDFFNINPEFISVSLGNIIDDLIIGVGVSDIQNITAARGIATTLARAEISRQLSSIVVSIVSDYMIKTDIETEIVLKFQQSITLVLSEARLVGSYIVNERRDEEGNYWVTIALPKANATREIVSAIEVAYRLQQGN